MKQVYKKLSVVAIVFIMLINIVCVSVSADEMTLEEYYASLNWTPLQTVIDINTQKINEINNYSAEFVIEYVSDNKIYNDVVTTLDEVQRLSDEICAGITTEYEKAKAIAYYVSNNIAYDFDAAHNSVTFDVICLKNVLERHRTTCAGFSNLFSALCQAQGLYCVNRRGASPEGDFNYTNLDREDAPTNHEWTAVIAEGYWRFFDCTWASQNRYENGEFSMNPPKTMYFDMPLHAMSVAHKAKIVDYRNFKDAVNAYNADGILWADVTEPPIQDPPIEDNPPIDDNPDTGETTTETEVTTTTIVTTTTRQLPFTWKVTVTKNNDSNSDSSSDSDGGIDRLEEIVTTVVSDDENSDSADYTEKTEKTTTRSTAKPQPMKPTEELSPYIIAVMGVGVGAVILIAVSIALKKKKK